MTGAATARPTDSSRIGEIWRGADKRRMGPQLNEAGMPSLLTWSMVQSWTKSPCA